MIIFSIKLSVWLVKGNYLLPCYELPCAYCNDQHIEILWYYMRDDVAGILFHQWWNTIPVISLRM